jgi:hypothetical protein
MVYLFDQVRESEALINHPDSCPYDMGFLITDELPDLFNFSCITELTRFNSRSVYAAAIPDDLALQSITDRMLDAQCNMQRRSFDYIYSLIRNHPCLSPVRWGAGRRYIIAFACFLDCFSFYYNKETLEHQATVMHARA